MGETNILLSSCSDSEHRGGHNPCCAGLTVDEILLIIVNNFSQIPIYTSFEFDSVDIHAKNSYFPLAVEVMHKTWGGKP